MASQNMVAVVAWSQTRQGFEQVIQVGLIEKTVLVGEFRERLMRFLS